MKLYREKIKHADGTIRESKTLKVDWRDHRNIRRRWSGFRDKKAAAEFGHRLERLAETIESGATLTVSQVQWIRGLRDSTRQRLAKIGMLGGEIVKSSGSLSRHLADYENHLKAKRNKPKSTRAAILACKQIIDGIGAIDVTQITPTAVEDWLRVGREVGHEWEGAPARPLSVSWSNHHLGYLKSFLGWLVRNDRADRNPLANVSKLNEDADPRHQRAVFTADQLKTLLKHVKDDPDRYWRYRLATETGLRASELRHLVVGAFNLGESPSVRVSGAYSKSGRTDVIPLTAATAKGLKAYFARKTPNASALVVPTETARALQRDLQACGIDYQTPDGLYLDFHALRHTFLTRVGYHAKSFADLQALARHAKTSAAVTMRYSHSQQSAMRTAIESANKAVK